MCAFRRRRTCGRGTCLRKVRSGLFPIAAPSIWFRAPPSRPPTRCGCLEGQPQRLHPQKPAPRSGTVLFSAWCSPLARAMAGSPLRRGDAKTARCSNLANLRALPDPANTKIRARQLADLSRSGDKTDRVGPYPQTDQDLAGHSDEPNGALRMRTALPNRAIGLPVWRKRSRPWRIAAGRSLGVWHPWRVHAASGRPANDHF